MIAFAAASEFTTADKAKYPTVGNEKPEDRAKVIDRAVYKFDGAGFTFDRRYHLHVYDVAATSIRQLTDGDFNDRARPGQPDSRHIAFCANRNPDWDVKRGLDVWIIAVEGGEPRQITKGGGFWGDPVFSPDGRQIAYLGMPFEDGEDIDFYTQVWVSDRSGSDPVNILNSATIDAGRSVGSDWAAGGTTATSWNKRGLYFISSVKASSLIYHWSGKDVTNHTPGEHDIMTFSVAANGTVAYAKSDETSPAEVFLLTNGKERQITSENAELLTSLTLAKPQRFSFVGADKEHAEGWVLKPVGAISGQTYPLLLYIHGGPATAYGHSFFHELQWWAAQGFGVAYCNPHGSSSYGRNFQNCIRHDWGNRDYVDIMAFSKIVSELNWVDEKRMAAAGGSYGGYMVNWMAGHTDKFAAYCTQRSICNMVSQGGTSDFSAFRQERSGGTPEGNPDILWNQSPLKYASNAKTPTLILHQELDHRCPIEQGEQWFSAMKRMGVPVRFIRFPKESHGMSRGGKPSRRYDRLGFMLEWFQRYV